MTNGNDFAFGEPLLRRDQLVDYVNFNLPLTKREYFAALAMQGLCSNSDALGSASRIGREDGTSGTAALAEACVQLADHLIAALNAQEGEGA